MTNLMLCLKNKFRTKKENKHWQQTKRNFNHECGVYITKPGDVLAAMCHTNIYVNINECDKLFCGYEQTQCMLCQWCNTLGITSLAQHTFNYKMNI